MMKKAIAPFICLQRLKQSSIRVILMMYLIQSIVQIYQTQEITLKRVPFGLLIDL